MSSKSDVIEIPIEISLKSIQELDKAKRDVNEVLQKQKRIKDTSSSQAVPTLGDDTRGGIFGGRTDSKTTFKDKTSKAPFQRQNEFKKMRDELRKVKEQQTAWKTGNIAKVQGFSSAQFSNVKGVAVNPFQFIFGTVARKLGKLGRAGLFVGIGLVIAEIVKFVISEQLKPGRSLDRRFRFLADKQILLNTNRREQSELRQKFKTVIVTTMPGLRGLGVQGQIGGNLYNPDVIPVSGLDQRIVIDNLSAKGVEKRLGGRTFG